MPVLEVQNVAKSYRLPGQKRIPVLEDVSLSVESGEHVAVIGRSGAGKTTLLNIIGGLDRPTSGDVRLAGESLFQGFGAARRRNRLRAAKIGFVFQSFHLMPELDIVENVLLPAMSGEQQRVALARALMCHPKIVLADEPTGNLDKLTGAEIMKLLFEVSETPFALVMVTHSQEAASLCDRILTLDHGHLSANAPSGVKGRMSS